jgi:hypothetical protein
MSTAHASMVNIVLSSNEGSGQYKDEQWISIAIEVTIFPAFYLSQNTRVARLSAPIRATAAL